MQSYLENSVSMPVARTGREQKQSSRLCLTAECIHASSSILEAMDESADPCEDFYQFACGRWGAHNPLNPDMSGLDTLALLKNEMRRVFKDLLEAPITDRDGRSAGQAKIFYKSCINETAAEIKKEKPLLELLSSLKLKWPNVGEAPHANSTVSNDLENFDWHDTLIEFRRLKFETFFQVFSQADQLDSSSRILQLDQQEPLIPSVDFSTARGKKQIEAYHSMMVLAAELLGANRTQAIDDMKHVVLFEIKMRTFLESSEKRRNFTAINHRMTLAEINEFVPELRIHKLVDAIFERKFAPNTSLVVYAPTYLKKLNDLISNTPKRTLANYMGWRVVYFLMNFLDRRFVSLRQRYTNVVTGTTHPIPRWRLCVTLVNINLGMVTGAMFLKNHYSPWMKASAEMMIRDIREAFLENLSDLDWMDSSTKQSAIRKALAMNFKVAYPDEILDQNWLERNHKVVFTTDNIFENIIRVSKFRHLKELETLGKENDLRRWLMTPGTVNAFYTRTGNFITLPAAILQPPMFHPSYPPAKNYGGIGVVIGHEITHGFDDKGRQFDEHGNLKQWWQHEALQRFKDKARCMIEQYSGYRVKEINMMINGFKTQGENIADNGGIMQSYTAFRRRQDELKSTKIRLPGVNFTDEQLFFLTYAQIWCSSSTIERAIQDVRFSDHTAPRYRVIGALSNSKEFSTAYRCPIGSPMNPRRKCSVW
ncbi:neprilysin-1 [Galendromus occidentalis]|uniref:Neprilysin-1 n=1 Tax=Galendromus occidentalis TaxID=34638 RepID=A0AAJ7L5R8_9ACAR|nr:neprilysin-1 [Galendromus occidentalis]